MKGHALKIVGYVVALLGLAFLGSSCLGANFHKEIHLHDSATWIQSDDFVVLGRASGYDSSFFILGMIPVTREPNVERAMSQILEKYPEGRSLINIVIQREDRPYFPLGLVQVVHVSADVVGLPTAAPKDEMGVKPTKSGKE